MWGFLESRSRGGGERAESVGEQEVGGGDGEELVECRESSSSAAEVMSNRSIAFEI
jgi:hypothetical protein